jgi:hypothetical protein
MSSRASLNWAVHLGALPLPSVREILKNGRSNSDVDSGGAGPINVGVRKSQHSLCLVLRHLCICRNMIVSNMGLFYSVGLTGTVRIGTSYKAALYSSRESCQQNSASLVISIISTMITLEGFLDVFEPFECVSNFDCGCNFAIRNLWSLSIGLMQERFHDRGEFWEESTPWHEALI